MCTASEVTGSSKTLTIYINGRLEDATQIVDFSQP